MKKANKTAIIVLALFLTITIFPNAANADACSNAVTQFNAAYQHYIELVESKGYTDPATIAAKNAYEETSRLRDEACEVTQITLCGDGVCEGKEDKVNCPEDCGEVIEPPPNEWDKTPEECNQICVNACDGNNDPDAPNWLQACYADCKDRCGLTTEECGDGVCTEDELKYNDCPEDCDECKDDSDCVKGEECVLGACTTKQDEYQFAFNTVFAKRDKFYANGKGQVQLEFHAQKKEIQNGVQTWVDASELSVSFTINRDSGGMTGVALGELSKQNAVTDSRGRATLAYTAPFIFAKSGAFIGSGQISASIRGTVEKNGKRLGGGAYYLEIHPPVYIEQLKANPSDVDEHGKGGVYFRIKDSLKLEKTVEFKTRRDEASFSIDGPFTATAEKKGSGEKFDLYVKPVTGVRSIDMEDLTEWADIYENMKKNILIDCALIGGNSMFGRIPGVGTPLQKWAGDNVLRTVIRTPATYGGGYLTGGTTAQTGTKIGEARTGTEAALYSATIALDGVAIGLGILMGTWKMEEGMSNGKDLLLSTSVNFLKEVVVANAKAHRVANAKITYYPRTIRVNVKDIDGYEVHGWVPFYVLRYE